MKLDLRPRCMRKRCNKLIRGKNMKSNYERYKPFCSFHCHEWHCTESALEYIESKRGYVKWPGSIGG